MKKFIKKLIRLVQFPFIITDFWRFSRVSDGRFSMKITDVYPRITDRTIQTNFDRHYVYHTAWAARVLHELQPKKHVDIASSLYFTGIASATTPIDFYDYRPAPLTLSNVTSKSANLLALPFPTRSVDSLSCMHVIEHIGLGRYGEPIDPLGDTKATRELARVLNIGGSLLFVVPIGARALIEFNAHRIYTYQEVLNLFPDLELFEFALIPEHSDSGGLIRNADPALIAQEHYACGCFWFKKL